MNIVIVSLLAVGKEELIATVGPPGVLGNYELGELLPFRQGHTGVSERSNTLWRALAEREDLKFEIRNPKE